MTQVPVLTLKLAKPGVELVLSALVKMPYEETAGLIREIEAQANFQLEMMRKAAEATQAPAATNPSPEAEQAARGPAEPIPATANTGD